MIAGVTADDQNYIDIIDRAGEIVHSWQPNWFDIWPNGPEGIPSERLPKKLPGAILHGVQIAENGDVILNYEFLSTIRLDACGNVKWRLGNLGHHAVDLADDGTIWVGSERWLVVGPSSYENQIGPMSSWAIEQLDQDGNQLQKKEIFEILVENDLRGLMHLSTLDNMRTEVVSDTLHLNDVEIFPSGQPSEIFSPGDILISLRNISTIIVVDPETWKVKFRSTGPVLRPHDADFAPNDQILVYDNRNLNPLPREDLYSRVVKIDARTGAHSVFFKGEGNARFYSETLGRQQLLPNGNLMLTSGHEGRVMEVGPDGRLLWQYFNIVDENYTGIVTEGHVLPENMDRDFFENHRKSCENT